jgi:outer membrane protein assembly factor BamB
MNRTAIASCLAVVVLTCILGATAASAASWPMKQHDMQNTGRADYTVPVERLNDSFFDVFLWQKPSPGSPNEGGFSGSSMTFFDGAGPGGGDIVVGTYHWPKGIQGMDRHTGAAFWSGLPDGGETIGKSTPAFSNDGSRIYVVNDATESGSYPNGHPLMAFLTTDGPGTYWHNGDNLDPTHLQMSSPTVGADGRVFLHAWVDRPYAGSDNGSAITEVWGAATHAECGHSDPTLYEDEEYLRVVVGSRWGLIYCYDGNTGDELWSSPAGGVVDASVTIDPVSGNIYVGTGDTETDVVGLDKYGSPLWDFPAMLVREYIPGTTNPHRAQAAGALSFDGATYYFQTNSEQGDGLLYAINTSDGSVKWTFETESLGWEIASSSPIVTENGVVVIGNNLGDTYFAILDEGTTGTLLDSYDVNPDQWETGLSRAVASATISPEGDLYLPLRTYWMTSNGDGDVPTCDIANVYSAFDLRPDAVATLPGPPWQAAFALNGAVQLTWQPVFDPAQLFDHYAVYRDTQPFSSLAGMTPIATIDDREQIEYLDGTAQNGTSYFYAVTSVTGGGGEVDAVQSIGPRTPFDETDLQVVSISRTPRFPRYDPQYEVLEITEPSGFGPYYCSVATGLGSGQTGDTQRFPEIGDPVTYTATVRNRGTNTLYQTISAIWSVDGVAQEFPSQMAFLEPNDTCTFEFVRTWDGESHEIAFAIDIADARPENNSLAIDTKSVAFLSYIDRTRMEEFREETAQYPQATTDDFIDWLNLHMARFNAMFADSSCEKRVHFDVLEVLDDHADDPGVDRILWAIFPFRYYRGEGSSRLSGYYSTEDDLDYGLLHEMGHQLGLIDIYQLDIPAEWNLVNGTGYTATDCLMRNVAHHLSRHSANAMNHWANVAHGYYGQYLYSLPEFVRLHLTGIGGAALDSAQVTVYQLADRPDMGKVITNQIKAQGTTDAQGDWTLPNVDVDPELVPPTFAGDELHDNPFGYVHVVGVNGVLLLKVEHRGYTDYTWLDITEVNNAYWAGQTGTALITRNLRLGGEIQHTPPAELTELNAASWYGGAEGATLTVSDDPGFKQVGEGSIRIDTDGGFDTWVGYPGDRLAEWDLTHKLAIHMWAYAENPYTFQEGPWIRLMGRQGRFEYHPIETLLNNAIGQWTEFVIPLAGDSTWIRTEVGSPTMAEITGIEIHADTWDYGYILWIDGLTFETDPSAVNGDPVRPVALAMAQNAPNPFTTGTMIRFTLPSPRSVELRVFDAAGRTVRTLVSQSLPAGAHECCWDGRDDNGRPAGTGVYFARLHAGSRTLERKMVVR